MKTRRKQRERRASKKKKSGGGFVLGVLLSGFVGMFLWGSTEHSFSAARSARKRRPASLRLATSQRAPRDWWRDAVFYEIFVRSFHDSDGDGIGDLRGLLQRLDYLNSGKAGSQKDLKVTGLWLMPLFASPSYHGYDVVDYRRINPVYGDLKVFRRLLKEARRRGIRVVVDLVLNHTSIRHPWFVRSARSTSSPYRSWYVWRQKNPGWTQPWGRGPVWHRWGQSFYYGIFWKGMPDLNLRHPPVRREVAQIARYWMKQGLDGFRLDGARHMIARGPGNQQNDTPETHRFWQEFRRAVKKSYPEALLLGEIWSGASDVAPYCQGNEMDLAFDFATAGAILRSVTSMTAAPLNQALQKAQKIPASCRAPFLTNHDMKRVMSQFHGRWQMMKTAATILLTLPGTPFLYYGEEIGLPNGPTHRDEDKRTPMAWDASSKGGFTTGKPWRPLTPHAKANVATQDKDPRSLLNLYRQLIRLRHRSPALLRGRWLHLPSSQEALLAYARISPRQRVLCLLNLSDETLKPASFQLASLEASPPRPKNKNNKNTKRPTTRPAPRVLFSSNCRLQWKNPKNKSSLRVHLKPYGALLLSY